MIYTMMQACEKTGMTYQGLKFYCNEGLVPNVKRDRLNRRIFDEHDIEWIKSLSCLKNCGMSIQEMKEYTKLCLDGAATIQQRKEILNIKKAQLEENIAALTALVE
ncbi:MAG: MerR family transcriptional regulator [Synergistaceae bacterium]|nr:MerR family transcriptional regulator [Synergistaceae bacterium]